MTCTCPKCQANIELDLPEVSEAGTPAACPACNARFVVHRESFGGRALHKTGSISCGACGTELGPEAHCSACGTQFPDIFVVGLGRKRTRRKPQKVKLTSSPLPKKGSLSYIPSLDASLTPEAAKVSLPKRGASSHLPKVVIAILVLLLLGGGGGYFYVQKRAETGYIKSFVLASYLIQTGIDRAQKSTAKKAAEWKARTDAGQPYTPQSSMEDDRSFGTINSRLDTILGKMNKPPEKYASCNDRVLRLQDCYNKMRTLVTTPGNSLQGFVDSSAKLDIQYKQALKLYKDGMPDEIMAELTSASKMFRGMQLLLH